ncbi:MULTISPECIES: hypothetical protein [unclassified Microcoleus]|uniref:hypothetical protein n=1 Tax=unclassified Microcoleus TaxID=2642155 RepID=UPI002FD6031D
MAAQFYILGLRFRKKEVRQRMQVTDVTDVKDRRKKEEGRRKREEGYNGYAIG